jgi:PAS domain S-box-containing protein
MQNDLSSLPGKAPSGPKANILLVDDTPANLLALEAMLDDPGHNFVKAACGEEALRLLLDRDFAVVLLDVRMPGLDGFETAQLIRSQQRLRPTPVIFLTAQGDDRLSVEQAYSLGAVDYLVKPLVPVVLRAKVAGFVELFEEKQEARRQADLLRQLVQGTADYAIFMLDPEGRVATWNAGAERIKGYRAEEIVGQHFSRFYPQEAIDRDWPAERLRQAVAEGRFEDEGWRVRKDGSRFWANVVLTALKDEAGRLRGFSKVTRDLTERRQKEEELRQLHHDLERRVQERTTALAVSNEALQAGIAERNKAEEALRASEARLRAELEAMTCLHALSTRLLTATDLRTALEDVLEGAVRTSRADFGNIQLFNPQITALEIIAQRGFQQDFLDYFRTVRVDEGSACARAMQSGERIIVEDVELDPSYEPHRCIAAAAGYRAVQSTPLKSRSGSVLGMLSTHCRQPHCPSERDQRFLDLYARHAADFIERIHADEALQTQSERLRLLWEAAAVLLSAGDPDAMLRGLFEKVKGHLGVDTYFNFMVNEGGDALRLVSCAGITAEMARSINRLEFGQAICGTAALHRRPVVATFIQQSADPKAELVRGFGIRAYACHPLMAGGTLIGTLSFASRSRDEFDPEELDFLRTICHYVTAAYERLQLIRQLQQANRHKDQFLAMLAHELRNPLAPVRNGLHILKSARADREAVEQARAVMERQVVHMARIVDDLLDVSRITRGKIELRTERLDLARLVRHVVEDNWATFEDAGLAARADVPEVPLWVQGDPTRLTQVVGNLLQNAVKFTPRSGTVSVRLTADASRGQAVLAVRDTGAGIEPDMLPRLFEPFAQADRSLDRSKGGLGLGLALVKGLVELHGGEVHAASDGPGRGAAFVVRLPMQPEPAAITGMPEAPTQAGTRLRILVVEDNRDSADSLRLLLKLYGYDVTVAYTGPTGVETAKAWRPDVVLCDIGLPGLDGYGVVRELRRNPATAQARMIAVTGYGGDEDHERSQEAGFDAHLTKPADPTALQALLGAGCMHGEAGEQLPCSATAEAWGV